MFTLFSVCIFTAMNYEESEEMAHCTFLAELKRAVQILLTQYVTSQAAYHSMASGHIFISFIYFLNMGAKRHCMTASCPVPHNWPITRERAVPRWVSERRLSDRHALY